MVGASEEVGRGVGGAPCQMVRAPMGQTTAAQMQSLAGMALSQEIAFMEMSQQQQASIGGLGPWTGGCLAEAPSSSMGTMAKREAFMILMIYLVSLVCSSVSFYRRERGEWTGLFDFYSMVSYFKGGKWDVS